jgi:hypothetical protein
MGAADSTLQANIDALSSSVDADRFDLRGNNTVAGDTIFNGNIHANDGITANTLIVEDISNDEIVLGGAGGEIESSQRLTFDGLVFKLTGSAAISGGDMILESGQEVKAGSFVTYSDATLKTNIQDMDDALGKVMSMRGVR